MLLGPFLKKVFYTSHGGIFDLSGAEAFVIHYTGAVRGLLLEESFEYARWSEVRFYNWPAALKSFRPSATRADMVFSPSRTHTRGSKYFLFGLSSPSGFPTCCMR